MNNSMRERIARAIASLRAVEYETLFPSDYEAADAVLAVLREPTEEMVDAGVSADHGGTLGKRAANCWQAMIDAAMNEDKT